MPTNCLWKERDLPFLKDCRRSAWTKRGILDLWLAGWKLLDLVKLTKKTLPKLARIIGNRTRKNTPLTCCEFYRQP